MDGWDRDEAREAVTSGVEEALATWRGAPTAHVVSSA
jgi:hypothetical protein